VILIRSNQEGFHSGQDFYTKTELGFLCFVVLMKSYAGFFGFCERNKLGKHRSRLQILGTILSVISGNEGAKKTQIMYQAYLSYKLLTRYLNDVLNAGLVVCNNENCFTLTSKGERFLERFGDYHKSREVVEKNLNHVEDQKVLLQEMCPNTGAPDVSSGSTTNKCRS